MAGSQVSGVDDLTMIACIAVSGLDAANTAAARGLTQDRAVAAFTDARAALSRIVELTENIKRQEAMQ